MFFLEVEGANARQVWDLRERSIRGFCAEKIPNLRRNAVRKLLTMVAMQRFQRYVGVLALSGTLLSLLPTLRVVLPAAAAFAPSLSLHTAQKQRVLLAAAAAATTTTTKDRTTAARDLVRSLVDEEQCFTTEAGARAWGEACAANIVYEDRFEPQPVVGRTAVTEHLRERARQRQSARGGGEPGLRIDKISDGNRACGFAWTWTCGSEEGLRGTTFVELNDKGEIQYVQEIPEPLFKPGDLTKDLLKAVTAGAEWKPPEPFTPQTPTAAHELAKYLFVDLQNADPVEGTDELMRFFDDNVVYRDFNYKDVLRGPAQVRQFVEDFSFPGIEFRPLRFDDGIDSTCFTWEVVLDDAPDTVKGLSFYELDQETRKITYVRDVPESALKPPVNSLCLSTCTQLTFLIGKLCFQ